MKFLQRISKRHLFWITITIGILFVSYILLAPLHLFTAQPALGQFQILSLEGFKRILIFAPHNDDETLGTAGVIQLAKKFGADIQIVIATNGDGYMFATMEDFRKVFPKPGDYIRLGNLRQNESIAAMESLGIKPQQLAFLSYPDRGSPAEWETSWDCDKPYRSPYTETNHSPYQLTYNPTSSYCGSDYLNDIKQIITNFRPDIVFYPHGEDVHPDHWGLSNFVRLALAVIRLEQPEFAPVEYQYLVHRPDFPEPSGYHPNRPLLPPISVFQVSPDWRIVSLSNDLINRKYSAVLLYQSQLPSLKNLLESFIRTNELFAPAAQVSIETGKVDNPIQPDSWIDSNGVSMKPILKDPIDDFFTRAADPSADIKSVYAITSSQNVDLCAEMVSKVESLNEYSLKIRTYDKKISNYLVLSTSTEDTKKALTKNGKFVCGTINLAELENPKIVMFAFETMSADLVEVDHTAWALLNLSK